MIAADTSRGSAGLSWEPERTAILSGRVARKDPYTLRLHQKSIRKRTVRENLMWVRASARTLDAHHNVIRVSSRRERVAGVVGASRLWPRVRAEARTHIIISNNLYFLRQSPMPRGGIHADENGWGVQSLERERADAQSPAP